MNYFINDIEKEILKEIVNIALAKSADAFATIANEKVLIDAPNVLILEPEEVTKVMPTYENHTFIIQSDLEGEINGKTYLLFSEDEANKIAEICLGTIKMKAENNSNLKESLLLEIGNIITGSLVTQFANIFKVNIFGSVPAFKNNLISNVLNNLAKEYPLYKPFIFTVKTQFVYSWRTMELPFFIVLNMEGFLKLLEIIRNYNKIDKSILRS